MRIVEITRPDQIEDASRLLWRSGYRDISNEPEHTSGSFSDVLYRADLPYVVKLFLATDTAYLRYLNLIRSVRNPHFPLVRGQPVRVNARYYGVRLEKLTPLAGREAETTRYWMESCLVYLAAGNWRNAKASAENLSPSEKSAMAQIYRSCIRGHPVFVDMHKFNVMMRGSTIVLIDPVGIL